MARHMNEAGRMFAKESDMMVSAARWMRSSGMTVRPEFVTPWGICDLVGLTFNSNNVAHRLELRQMRPISSITRAVLLLQIPDAETKRSTTLSALLRKCMPSIPEEIIFQETAQLIADRFVISSSSGRLQKINGWMPLHDRLAAIELKLMRVEEAMHQAMNNLGFAEESYVGLPSEVARRVASNAHRWSYFFEAGVGLLSVTSRGCKVLVPPRKRPHWTDAAIQLYCVEKFWRSRTKGN
jgi:hypothetical protein